MMGVESTLCWPGRARELVPMRDAFAGAGMARCTNPGRVDRPWIYLMII
jgi:hypothetical protein